MFEKRRRRKQLYSSIKRNLNPISLLVSHWFTCVCYKHDKQILKMSLFTIKCNLPILIYLLLLLLWPLSRLEYLNNVNTLGYNILAESADRSCGGRSSLNDLRMQSRCEFKSYPGSKGTSINTLVGAGKFGGSQKVFTLQKGGGGSKKFQTPKGGGVKSFKL